jgi:thymidylate synthase
MNGRTLTGTAYGPKIFRFGNAAINQWEKVVELLSSQDRDSKRAVIQIFDPSEWLIQDNQDVSCTLALQFLVRENKLYLLCSMRANDAFRGMLSDIFSFTFLQELMARQLDLELGDYYHNVGTFHLYETDIPWTKRVLHEVQSDPHRLHAPFRFPELPSGNNWEYLRVVLDYERQLRRNTLCLESKQIEEVGLPLYWQQVLLLFEIHREIVYDSAVDRVLFERLLPLYQYLLVNKWSFLPGPFISEERSVKGGAEK